MIIEQKYIIQSQRPGGEWLHYSSYDLTDAIKCHQKLVELRDIAPTIEYRLVIRETKEIVVPV